MQTAGPVREICSECGKVSPVGFKVPDEIWAAVMPLGRREDIMCIMCFARFADRKNVRWDEEIEFYPVSKKKHRERTESIRKILFKDNLHRIRQWFGSVQDLSRDSWFEPEDYDLARHIYRVLGMRVPSDIEENCTEDSGPVAQ